ncbi:unnamed protein product [Zymoseptoria tritici ST99CH_1E4]|uniref:Uncharacterized protein n=1 Tax=Zymoseptoria tritici ST99CH_1E4 TaxID=1276532 RepID=A0A2H1G6N3_ZYMTR|nr:unnamed protein product [Zymoseptoria tritici ST99CH_1E4]
MHAEGIGATEAGHLVSIGGLRAAQDSRPRARPATEQRAKRLGIMPCLQSGVAQHITTGLADRACSSAASVELKFSPEHATKTWPAGIPPENIHIDSTAPPSRSLRDHHHPFTSSYNLTVVAAAAAIHTTSPQLTHDIQRHASFMTHAITI